MTEADARTEADIVPLIALKFVKIHKYLWKNLNSFYLAYLYTSMLSYKRKKN